MTIIRRKPHTYPGYFVSFFSIFLSRRWRDGQYIEALEKKLGNSLNQELVVCTSYGLHAMSLILSYYNFTPGSELLIPGYTAKVVQKCLDELKINYICIDIDPLRGTMCPRSLSNKITKKSRGILITHLLGNACSQEVFNIAREHNLIIIEDCAHAQGAFLDNKPCGTLGHAGFFSFSYSKLINTYTGGALVTRDENLYIFAKENIHLARKQSRLQLLRKFIMGHAENFAGFPIISFLLTPILKKNSTLKKLKNIVNYFTRSKMINFFQFTNTQALLGLQQLSRLEETLKIKKEMALYIQSKTKIKFLIKNDGDVFYNFIAIVPNAKRYHEELIKRKIDTGYGSSIMEVIDVENKLEGCAFALEHYLLLPNYTSLNRSKLDDIIKAINEVDQLFGASDKALIK